MKFRNKLFLIIAMLFIVSDLLIFIGRNSGFEYKKFSTEQELYPPNQDNTFLNKWTNYNKRFSREELDQGLILLNHAIRIDTISKEENKVIQIAGWLYHSFYKQIGTPGEKKLWCGNFQAIVGFFCTAAMLPNRYVEIAPTNDNPDTHEVNEVYLTEIKKWVMVDATRNLLLARKDYRAFSAAEYFDYKLQKNGDGLSFIRIDTASGIYTTTQKDTIDKYFDEDHFLRYYYTLDLFEAYSFWPKMKRYFLANPWYEIYSPGEQHSNLLFRIKQFFFFGLIAMVAVLVFLYSNAKPRTGRG